MANIFQIKRRSIDSGAPSSLAAGELAFNESGKVLYIGNEDGSIKKIGGEGAFVTLDSAQTVTAGKAFTGLVDLGSAAVAVSQDRTDMSGSVATTSFVQDVASLLDGGSF